MEGISPPLMEKFMITMVTETGEEHGLIKKLSNASKFNDFKHMTPETKAKCEKQKKEDNRMVKARYINHRGQHERLTKPYCRWSGDPIEIWHFIPGRTYDVPYGLVQEVNSTSLPIRSKVDGDKTPVGKIESKQQIHEFVPISF